MIFTFYSFKGGVGRSMSMAAVAYLFAQRGLKVLAIDFDLEAPGLERYFFDSDRQLETVRSAKGVIDLVLAYKRALTDPAEFKAPEFRDLSRFVVDAVPQTARSGSVHLMTAGRRAPDEYYAQYALNVRSFDWQDFFSNWRGDRFFEWLRGELNAPDTGYDVVLVDSRTGVTEMGGVCAYQLADTAVLLCAPNYQNLDGTRAIVNDFRSDPVMVVRKGRPLEIVVVLARVENENDSVAEQRERFLADVHRTFGSEGLPKVLADVGLNYESLAVRYHPELAIVERVIDRESQAHGDFERLMHALTLLTTEERFETHRAVSRAWFSSGQPDAPAPIADVTKRSAGHDLFLHGGRADAEHVIVLARLLTEHHLDVVVNPLLSLGANAQELMLRTLDYSSAVAVCIGGSPPEREQWELIREAQARRLPLISVLLPGASEPEATTAVHGALDAAIDLRGGFQSAEDVAPIVRMLAMLGHRGMATGTPEPASVDPYPGAASFIEDQSEFFCGRDADTLNLLACFDSHRGVLLTGGSAVGKTSLVQAGLVPRVRRREGAFSTESASRPWLVECLATLDDVRDAVDRRSHEGLSESSTLFVLDALDSGLLDSARWPDRERAIARLIDAAAPHDRFLFVWRGTLADGEQTAALAGWAARLGEIATYRLEPIPRDQIREVIERPAVEQGNLFEPGCIDRLIADGGDSLGAIAQIAMSLRVMWDERRRGWLTYKSYEARGGIAGQYAARLDALLSTLTSEERDATLTFLTNLLVFDKQLHATAEWREWHVLRTIPVVAPHADGICNRLVDARLIDIWRTPRNEVMVCLSQATIPPVIDDAARTAAEFLLWRQRFATYVDAYAASGGPLVEGAELEQAQGWFASHSLQMTADERLVIEHSQRQMLAMKRVEERRARGRVLGGAVASVVAIALIAFVVVVFNHVRDDQKAQAVNARYLQQQQGLLAAQDQLKAIRESLEQKQAQTVGASPQDKQQLQSEIATLQQRARTASSQVLTYQTQLETLQKVQAEMSSQNNALLQRLQDLQARLLSAQKDAVDAQGERDALRARLANGDTDSKYWRERAQTAEARLAETQGKQSPVQRNSPPPANAK